VALFRQRSGEAEAPPREGDRPRESFLPSRDRRPRIESIFVRLIATGGIIGLGAAVGAILGSQDVAAWIVGIVVATLSILLAAILWSSRRL